MPTSAGTASVSLDALGAVGTSNWTVDTNWSGPQQHLVLPSVSAGNPYSVTSPGFEPNPDGTATAWTAMFSNSGTLKPGTTYIWQNVVAPPPPFSMSIAQGDSGCELESGSVTINDLATVGPDHVLSRLDALLKASCRSSVPYSVTARMLFHETADRTRPAVLTGLQAVRSGNRVTLRWTKPSATDLGGVMIRW